MRPVNLLPANLRPRERKATGNGGYIVLGVLAALLVATALYVVTANQVTTRQAETQELKAETQAAQQRAGALAPFGAFQAVKAIRTASVTALAAGRLDWERMSRELARLLPAGVWLTELDATATGEAASSSGGSSSASSSSSGSAAGGAAGQAGPSLNLIGCAPSQEAVAETMVRLRRLHQAADVTLESSEREESSAAGSAVPTTPAPAGGVAAGPEGCGSRRGRQNYKFDVSVTLAPTVESTPGGASVPSSLGGGS